MMGLRKGETHIVVHVCGSENPDRAVVRKLGLVDFGAVVGNVSSVVDGICFAVQESYVCPPIPRLFSPVSISRIAGVTGQTGPQIEETTISNTCRCISQPSS